MAPYQSHWNQCLTLVCFPDSLMCCRSPGKFTISLSQFKVIQSTAVRRQSCLGPRNYAVSSEQRHLQGHHSYHYQSSMRLYSKDDVFGALQLQSVVINHIQKGMRPVQPVHRGGQEAFPTPSVELESERVFFSKSCTMDD